MTTVDLTSISLGGTGSGTTRTFDYGTHGGLNFTLTMTVEGASDSGNPGGPALTGNNVSGRLEYSTGNGPGTTGGIRVNRITITSNRPLDGLKWGVFGISGSPGEHIAVTTPSATQSGMGAGSTGTIAWTGLNGETSVSFDYWSESDGNNACFGPIGNADLTVGGGDDDDGDTYIREGTVFATGAPTTVGVYEGFVNISDANGFVVAVPVRFEVLPGDPPVITSPTDQANDVGDVVSLTLSSTNPQSQTLEYLAANLPVGLDIDSATGEISGTITSPGRYEVELVSKDENGQCSTVVIDWEVDGEDETDIENITGPTVIGRYSGTGAKQELTPQIARETIGVYSKSQTDDKDAATLVTIRGGILEDYDTLEKLRAYLKGLIDLINGGEDVDLSPLYNILGVGVNDTEMPAVGAISAGSIADQIEDLEARIPDDTAALPDMPGETLLVRALTSTGPPSNKTYSEVRSLLSLYTQAQITAFLANKFDDSKGDNLVSLTGRPLNSTHLGTAVTSSRVADNQDIVEMFNAVLGLIDDLYNNGGGGGGSLTLDGYRIAANLGGSTATASGATYGQIRSALDVLTANEIQTDLNQLKAQIDGEQDADHNSISATLTNAINLKASQDQVDRLTQLTGAGTNALQFTSFPGNILSDYINIYQALVALESSIEGLQASYLGAGTWADYNLFSTHGSRGWAEARTIRIRLSRAGDECHIIGAVTRLTGTATFSQGISILSTTVPASMRPQQDTTYPITGYGNGNVTQRVGSVTVKTNGQLVLSGDDGDSNDTTKWWNIDGRWAV